MSTEKINKRQKRRLRIRAKIFGRLKRPRLSVFRSNKHIYAQVIDDSKGATLVSASDLELVKPKKKTDGTKKELELQTKKDIAFLLGDLLAKKALKKKIKKVIFDRGGYRYHGRVKALAEGARKGGLEV